MLAALGMAWGWCQPSPVTFCPLRAAVAPPASPEHLPLHMLCCRALILHIQPIPSLLKPALEALLRGVWAVRVCIWAVCTGPVPEFVCGVTGGARASSPSGQAASEHRGPALLLPRYPLRPAEVALLPARHPSPLPLSVAVLAGSCSPASRAARRAASAGDSRSQRPMGRWPRHAF